MNAVYTAARGACTLVGQELLGMLSADVLRPDIGTQRKTRLRNAGGVRIMQVSEPFF